MRTTFTISIFILTLLWPWNLLAADSLVDLSTGVAIPANSTSTRENPAALTGTSVKIFDFSVLMNSSNNTDFGGAFASSAKGFGYGIDLRRVSQNWVPTAGLGFSLGKFSLGVNATSSLSPFSPVFGLGIKQDLKKLIFALFFQDLGNLGRDWSIGFGFPLSQNLRLETDLSIHNSNPGFGMSQATPGIAGEYFINQKFTALLRYRFQMIPSYSDQPGLGAGLSFWLNHKTAIYGIYKDPTYNWIVGLKFLL
jgi:hypothetical protein